MRCNQNTNYYDNSRNSCYKPNPCPPNPCPQPTPCPCPPQCSKAEVIAFLGLEVFKLLETVQLPPGHPSLFDSLCALIQGVPLPPGHPTLPEILCLALKCN